MKSTSLISLLLLLTLFLCACGASEPEPAFDEASEGVISVILEDTNDCTIHYDTIGPVSGETRLRQETQPFESDPVRIYKTPHGCFDLDNNILSVQLIDENSNPVEVTETYARIIELAAQADHNVMAITIYQLEQEIFAVAEWNVNLWSPFVLYHFDQDADKLELLYKYDATRVVGIRILNL